MALTLTIATACSSGGTTSTTPSDTTPSDTTPSHTTPSSTTPSSTTPSDTTPSSTASSTEPPSAPSAAPASSPSSAPSAPPASIDIAALQAVLDGVRATLPTGEATVQATVLSVSRDVVWSSSSGPDPDAAGRPFRMASVGKTITAATVLRLGELGLLDLDAPITGLLDPDDVSLLSSDGYDPASITPRQLLAHTAGVYDYAFGDGSTFLEDALADRRHHWTRREQLQLAVDAGDPLWDPGTGFAYSDTGYVLLGEIIEQVTGEPYHVAARDLLGFDRLGLDHLWLETFEPAPVGLAPISRSFLVAEEVSDLDFSLDAYGGGGYAGTTADVARFLSALLDGEVFDDPATLEAMLTIPDTNLAREEFGVLLGDGAHGLYRIVVDGRVCWSHRGFLGTIVLACPDQDVTVVLTTNVALTDPLAPAMQLVALADPRRT